MSYLTDEEKNMPLGVALLQLTIGLQTCKTKKDVVELLQDAVQLGRIDIINVLEKNMVRHFENDEVVEYILLPAEWDNLKKLRS